MQQQARTRAVLAALGIPLWAARREPTQTIPSISVWDRQEEQVSAAQVEAVQPVIHKIDSSVVEKPIAVFESIEEKFVQPQVEMIPTRSSTELSIVKTQSDIKPIRQPFTQPVVANEVAHVTQVLRFSLEARVIGNWVVLVSVQALNHPDRNALWKNLNQALVSSDHAHEVGRLDWPLAEGARWQHNEGAQAALMGFLSRFGSERRIGLMGELPDHVIPERLERLPSLDELLQEPLKKRTLWRLLTGSIR